MVNAMIGTILYGSSINGQDIPMDVLNTTIVYQLNSDTVNDASFHELMTICMSRCSGNDRIPNTNILPSVITLSRDNGHSVYINGMIGDRIKMQFLDHVYTDTYEKVISPYDVKRGSFVFGCSPNKLVRFNYVPASKLFPECSILEKEYFYELTFNSVNVLNTIGEWSIMMIPNSVNQFMLSAANGYK